MRFVLVLLAAAAFVAPASAALQTTVLAPVDDVSLPFLCSWGYDWQERCFRDDLDRLEVGGAGDKVWRSALRFSLDALPPGATVVTAELWLRYDGTCTAPRRRTVPCDGRGFSLEGRPIFTPNWYVRREVAFGPASRGPRSSRAQGRSGSSGTSPTRSPTGPRAARRTTACC
jgi:hypothetical protein